MAARKPAVGHQTYLSIGAETTWGTAVTPDRSIRVLKTNLERSVSKKAREELLHSANSRNTVYHYLESDYTGGSFTTYLRYEGLGLLLKHLMYKSATTGSGSPWTHTYSLDIAPPTGGLTIETVWYDIETPGLNAETLEGGSITKATFRGTVGKPIEVDWEVIGETTSGINTSVTGTSTAPFSSNDVPVLFNQAGTFSYNSITLYVTSFQIVVDNALERRQTFAQGLVTAKPISGRNSITAQIECEWDSSTFDGALIADTVATLSLTFTGTSSRTCTFTSLAAVVMSCSRPIATASGTIKQTAQLMLKSNGSTNEGLTIVIANTQNSAIAV